MIWMARVDLPADSAPKTSVTRPRGIPPMPNAMSRAREPVGMHSVARESYISPRRITAPFPWSFSICPSAVSRASCLILFVLSVLSVLVILTHP